MNLIAKFKSIAKGALMPTDANKIPNVLMCTNIGDALGMPFEGLKCDNESLVKWDGKTFLPSRPRPTAYYGSSLNVKAGCYTDDGQMSIMVAESLIENKKFNPKDLSERYVDWIYTNKARGFGRTTKLAIDNLKSGMHWTKSGVEGSFGNGTAMRAAPFGVFYAKKDFSEMYHAVKIDSAITHRSVEAEAGALAVAITTYLVCRKAETEIPAFLAVHLPESVVKTQIFKAYDMAAFMKSSQLSNATDAKMLAQLGTGADVRQTVPASLYCFWRFSNYADAVVAAIRAGRDSDTTAAIVGGMFGGKTRLGDIPLNWVRNVENSAYLRELDTKLSE